MDRFYRRLSIWFTFGQNLWILPQISHALPNSVRMVDSPVVSKPQFHQETDSFRENSETYSLPSQLFRLVFSVPKRPLLILYRVAWEKIRCTPTGGTL